MFGKTMCILLSLYIDSMYLLFVSGQHALRLFSIVSYGLAFKSCKIRYRECFNMGESARITSMRAENPHVLFGQVDKETLRLLCTGTYFLLCILRILDVRNAQICMLTNSIKTPFRAGSRLERTLVDMSISAP